MKRLIALPLLLFACLATAAPADTSSSDKAAQAASEAARASDEAARAGEEASRQAADAQRLAELQARMNDLAQRMADLSVKVGDQASASALRYLADSKRGMLGIVLEDDAAGLRVAAVTPGGPAERAGIRDGDVITAINGTSAGTGGDSVLADALVAGRPVSLAVSRGGKSLEVHVTPERFQAADWQALARAAQAAAQQSAAKLNSPEFRKQLDRDIEQAMKQTAKARADMAAQWGEHFRLDGRGFAPWWGLNLASLNPQLGRYFGTDSGALVLSNDAQRYPGLQAGDVITAVDGRAVARPDDVMRALQSLPTDATAHIKVLRHGTQVALDFKVPARGYLLPPEPPAPPPPPAPPVVPPPPPPPSIPASAAAQSPRHRDAQSLAGLERHAGPPQQSMHYFRLDNFQYLGRNSKGENAIAVWTGVNQVYLLTLQNPCINLDSALAIGMTSTSGDVNAGMDYVKYSHNGPQQCRIMTIRKVDYKAMRRS